MSLALMFALDEAGIALPSQVVLISPLLDATGTDPKLAEIQPNDPWLSISAGKQWAGGPDVKNVAGSALRHPYVSPLFGDLSLLKRAGTRVVLCCGTYDILYADALRFAEKCEESGVQCHFIEGQGQIHIFSLLNRFVPEASLACGRTCSIIETNSGISRPSLT